MIYIVLERSNKRILYDFFRTINLSFRWLEMLPHERGEGTTHSNLSSEYNFNKYFTILLQKVLLHCWFSFGYVDGYVNIYMLLCFCYRKPVSRQMKHINFPAHNSCKTVWKKS